MALADLLTGMANATRQKDGTTAQINAYDLPKRIFEIPGNVPGAASKTYTGADGLKALFNDVAVSIRALDGTTAEIEANTFPERILAINVADLKLPVPTAPPAPTYTDSAITPTFPGYDSTKMTATGITGTNAGNYTATFSLKRPHYRWADGSKTAKTVSWSIEKARPYVRVDETEVTIEVGESYSISVMHPYNFGVSAGTYLIEGDPDSDTITVGVDNPTDYDVSYVIIYGDGPCKADVYIDSFGTSANYGGTSDPHVVSVTVTGDGDDRPERPPTRP